MSLSETISLARQKALLNQEEFVSKLNANLVSVSRCDIGKSISNISAMKAIKTFCEENSYYYELIETERIKSRMEVNK